MNLKTVSQTSGIKMYEKMYFDKMIHLLIQRFTDLIPFSKWTLLHLPAVFFKF